MQIYKLHTPMSTYLH